MNSGFLYCETNVKLIYYLLLVLTSRSSSAEGLASGSLFKHLDTKSLNWLDLKIQQIYDHMVNVYTNVGTSYFLEII